jgi:hypothetical protein
VVSEYESCPGHLVDIFPLLGVQLILASYHPVSYCSMSRFQSAFPGHMRTPVRTLGQFEESYATGKHSCGSCALDRSWPVYRSIWWR